MSAKAIKAVWAREVYSRRGHPGVEAIVVTESGCEGRAICTSGISIGTHEIKFNLDGGTKWNGKGVMGAVKNINDVIGPAIIGMDATNQFEIDNAMLNICEDAKVTLGGNAVAAVSAAALKAGAKVLDIPLYQHIGGANAMYLPVPGAPAMAGNERYGGGVTTPGAKPTYSFMCFGFDKYSDASYACWEIYQKWTELMMSKYYFIYPGATNFFGMPPGAIESDEQLWEMMADTIRKAGYEGKAGFQCDCASDTYYDREKKLYHGLFGKNDKTRDEMLELYKYAVKNYPFVILEDPFYEDDYESHAMLREAIDIQIVGDDLFTTMPSRVAHGIQMKAANTVLLKVNQVGTITESLEMIQLAYKNGYGVMPCESRGEGASIADYCVGINAGSVRECGIGDIANRFLEIEMELGSRAKFIGAKGLKGRRFEA